MRRKRQVGSCPYGLAFFSPVPFSSPGARIWEMEHKGDQERNWFDGQD